MADVICSYKAITSIRFHPRSSPSQLWVSCIFSDSVWFELLEEMSPASSANVVFLISICVVHSLYSTRCRNLCRNCVSFSLFYVLGYSWCRAAPLRLWVPDGEVGHLGTGRRAQLNSRGFLSLRTEVFLPFFFFFFSLSLISLEFFSCLVSGTEGDVLAKLTATAKLWCI